MFFGLLQLTAFISIVQYWANVQFYQKPIQTLSIENEGSCAVRECLHQFEYLIGISKETKDHADCRSWLDAKDQVLFKFFLDWDLYINSSRSVYRDVVIAFILLCNPSSFLCLSLWINKALTHLWVSHDYFIVSCLFLYSRFLSCRPGLQSRKFFSLDLYHVIGTRLLNVLKFFLFLNLFLLSLQALSLFLLELLLFFTIEFIKIVFRVYKIIWII